MLSETEKFERMVAAEEQQEMLADKQKQQRYIMLTDDEYESLLRWQVLDQGAEARRPEQEAVAVGQYDELRKAIEMMAG
jgi:hypothetical protein